MIAGHAQAGSGTHHGHYPPQHIGDLRAPVHQITPQRSLCGQRAAQHGTVPSWSIRRNQAVASRSVNSSKHPCTSPMMSKGPCSCFRLFHSGCRSILSHPVLLGVKDVNVTEILHVPTRARERLNCCDWFLMTWGPKSRSGRVRFRSWQSFSGKLKTKATAEAAEIHEPRRQAVYARRAGHRSASITVSRPAASRFLAMKCRISNASFVAD